MVQPQYLEDTVEWMKINAERFVRADDSTATMREIVAKHDAMYALSSDQQPLGRMFAAYIGVIRGTRLRERLQSEVYSSSLGLT